MAETEPPTDPIEPDLPPAEPGGSPPPPAEPAPADPAVTAARLAALEAQHAALRAELAARPAPEPAPAPAEALPTLEQVEAWYKAGQISAEQRLEARTALLARQQATQIVTASREAERRQQIQTAKTGRLQRLLTEHPYLTTPTDPRTRDVTAELDDLEALGYDRADAGTQVLAIERVVGRKGTVMDQREFQRRRAIVAGTVPGGGAAPPAAAADPLKGIPPDYVAYWRSRGANLADPATAQKYAARFWATRPGQRVRSAPA